MRVCGSSGSRSARIKTPHQMDCTNVNTRARPCIGQDHVGDGAPPSTLVEWGSRSLGPAGPQRFPHGPANCYNNRVWISPGNGHFLDHPLVVKLHVEDYRHRQSIVARRGYGQLAKQYGVVSAHHLRGHGKSSSKVAVEAAQYAPGLLTTSDFHFSAERTTSNQTFALRAEANREDDIFGEQLIRCLRIPGSQDPLYRTPCVREVLLFHPSRFTCGRHLTYSEFR